MILFERGHKPGKICVGSDENSAVRVAARNMARDIGKVCGVCPALTDDAEDAVVVIGTRGVTAAVDGLRWDAIAGEDGLPRWEGYIQQAREGRLYLAGNDRRGTVYAVYTLCEAMGVSPWYDLADVPPKERDRVEVPDGHFLADWPCVQYRGIFLNDEEELDAWAKEHTSDGTIGPQTYAKIFELILRLKGNFIWPAMHVNAFNNDPENGRLAERMGIVTGTSHCDMLHRSNQNEWRRWVAKKGYEGLQYDYTIPGQNRARLLEYWRESLEQNREFECCYTVGMRGIHDSGFITSGLDENASEEESMRAKRELLEEIMDAQRALIREVIPGGNPRQSFVPYKEVLPIYDSGLRVPDDVTLIWVDDNHGYVRRYPNPEEQKRSGGNGLYYHSSYWAPPGMSYLFLGSTPLAHMGNELKKCYAQGIRRIWVDNVGALKPLEQDAEYFLRYAWDAGRPESLVHDPRAYVAAWIDRNFTGGHGREAADIYTAFAQLSNLCKPEHMRSDTFSQTAYGDEAAARLNALYALTQRAQGIHSALPETEKDAFYQLMLMKIQATFYIAASYYYADRSLLAYERGAMRAAEVYTARSREMDDLKRLLIHTYNHVMSGGKWHGILTPEEFPPPPLEMFPRCRPALRLGEGRLLVTAEDWGARERLVFDAGGRKTKWIALYNTGMGELPFCVETPEGVAVSCARGSVAVERRLMVTVSDGFRQGKLVVRSGKTEAAIELVRMQTRALPDGWLRLPAAMCAASRGFARIAHMGRGVGDAMEASAETSPENPAEMAFEVTLRRPCAPLLEIVRFLTLNSTGQIRLRVSVDAWQTTLCSETTDEWRGRWIDAAMHDGEKLTVRLPLLPEGTHTLRVEALDPYITLCALNLYEGERLPCLMGPGVLDTGVDIPDLPAAELKAFYAARAEDVPAPHVVIADDAFFAQDMVYARNPLRRFSGWHAQEPILDAPKDRLAALDAGVVREENGRLTWRAERALLENENAWTTQGAHGLSFIHRQAETDGRQGLAMCLPALGRGPLQEDGEALPALHFRFRCERDAVYHLWLLVKYDDACGFACRFLIDGRDVRETAILCRDDCYSYRTIFTWCWQKLVSVRLSPGEHILTIRAAAAGMAFDRIYMTAGDEKPDI